MIYDLYWTKHYYKKSANETVASYFKFTKSRGQTILLQHEEVHYMESINISIPEY